MEQLSASCHSTQLCKYSSDDSFHFDTSLDSVYHPSSDSDEAGACMHLQLVHLEEGNAGEWEYTSKIIDWYSAIMEEEGNKIFAEKGRDGSESDSKL